MTFEGSRRGFAYHLQNAPILTHFINGKRETKFHQRDDFSEGSINISFRIIGPSNHQLFSSCSKFFLSLKASTLQCCLDKFLGLLIFLFFQERRILLNSESLKENSVLEMERKYIR